MIDVLNNTQCVVCTACTQCVVCTACTQCVVCTACTQLILKWQKDFSKKNKQCIFNIYAMLRYKYICFTANNIYRKLFNFNSKM